MNSRIFAALLLGIAATAPAQAVERKLLVAGFENIIVIGDIRVIVETGKAPSARASGDRRVLDSLKLERVGTTLRVRLQDIINNEKGIPFSEPLLVTLSTRELRDVAMSGNGQLSINEVKQIGPSRVAISGGGQINIGRVMADRLIVDVVGNGAVAISGGVVRDSRVTMNGGGQYRAENLATRNLWLQHSGNATTSATVSENAEINNSGSGNIVIGGNGTCFIKKAGAAAINCPKVDGAKR